MTEESAGAQPTVREVVGVFQDQQSFQNAVDDLLTAGFDRSSLSLLAGHRAIEAKLGNTYDKVTDLEDDPQVPRVAYIGKDSLVEAKTGAIGTLAYVGALAAVGAVVASGGTLAAAIAAAVIAGGGGGVVGTVVSRHLGRAHGESIAQQLEKGGLLLWVRTRDADQETRAIDTLNRNGGADVHGHDMPAPNGPEADPFDGFEPDPFLPNARV